MTTPTVVHNTVAHRFEADLDGDLAMVEYLRRGDQVVFTHTEVPPEHEGEGVASAIARTALAWARAEGLKVIPQCHFIAGFVEKNGEYADIMAKDW